MMLPTDYALIQDKSFKKFVKAYAADQDLFFKEQVFKRSSMSVNADGSRSFSKAFSTLLELGVPEKQWVSQEPWLMKTVEEQESK